MAIDHPVGACIIMLANVALHAFFNVGGKFFSDLKLPCKKYISD